jgi:thiol-disulfide isomerase/thioredoxin
MSPRPLIVLLLTGTMLIGGCDRQSRPAGQENTASAALPDEAPAAPAAPSSGAKPAMTIDRGHKGEAAPGIGFADPDGKPVTLASFKGKPVLLNLWATWCAPCVAEMPTLDKLAAREAGRITVLTVSQDLDGKPIVMPFFAKGGYRSIKPYLDSQAALSTGYQANLPTTILYDSTGHELWRVAGGMDWTGAEAAALVAEAK